MTMKKKKNNRQNDLSSADEIQYKSFEIVECKSRSIEHVHYRKFEE